MINEAKKWIGYLEHQNGELLGVFEANVGKGGFTIFSEMVARHYQFRNFSGLPWCTVFVHSVFIETLGKEHARKILGKPHPGSRVLLRRMKRKGWLRSTDYVPKPNDLIFLHNGDGNVSHVGIVEGMSGDTVISIEGNTIDPSGTFEKQQGGAVARRYRKLTDPAIVCYAEIVVEEPIKEVL